jgi:mannose-6-phosphate isomerase-like protein (cupin superfamily)
MADTIEDFPEGFRVSNPFNGETFIFTHMRDDDQAVEFDVHLAAGGLLTGTGMHHHHPQADEQFSVNSGRLIVSVAGVRHMLEAGQSLTVARGVPHHFRNGHAGETLFTCRFTPGQDFLRFFLNMALTTARHPERYDARGEPPLALRALALHAYAGHGYTSAVPVWVQRLLFAALTPVALIKGYRLEVAPRRRGRAISFQRQ